MSSLTIMNRLKTSLTGGGAIGIPALTLEKPNVLTRYFGGHNRKNHPFINGYWQLYLSPPQRIFGIAHNQAIEWFHSTAEGFTPPSRNLNKADVPGQGGLGSSYVTGQTLSRNFSLTFREYRDMPNMQLLNLWSSVIDPYTGVSEEVGEKWDANFYKGSCFVILTKPVGAFEGEPIGNEDIEEVYYFHGVWPENTPYDTMATDISSNDVVQYAMNFSFDGFPLTKIDDGVVDQAVTLLNNREYIKHTYDLYLKDVTSTKYGDIV